MSDDEHNSPEVKFASIGERLKNAREAKKLSVTEAAEKLHYHERWIKNLESDDYLEFSAIAYAKGYLRAYAKLLDLPADEIIRELGNYNLESILEPRRPELIVTHQASTKDRSVRWVTYGIGAILVVLVIVWINSMHKDSQMTTTNNLLETHFSDETH